MRTKPELPDALLRCLKILASRSGESLKALPQELIVRAIAMPVAPAAKVVLDFLHLQPEFEVKRLELVAINSGATYAYI